MIRFRLRYFVGVMRKFQVEPSRTCIRNVWVSLNRSYHSFNHGRTFNVPARSTDTPRRRPVHYYAHTPLFWCFHKTKSQTSRLRVSLLLFELF
jgi:hypothetical protein